MKALVYHGPEDLRYEEVEDPRPGSGEVRIKVKSVGICGSDVHGYLGKTGRRIPPMIMGHEFAGVVEQIGEGVNNFKIGDRVVPYPIVYCGQCDFCRQGKTHLCINKKSFGVLDCNGAMAEYICVPGNTLFRISDNVSFNVAAMVEPLSVAYRGVNTAGDLTGKNVLIVGAGTIGLLVLAVVKLRNPAKIFVCDLNDYRLLQAKKMGADFTINSGKVNPQDIIKEQTGGLGADVAIETVGVTPTVQQAMSGLKLGGTAIWIGNSAKMITVNMQEIVTRVESVWELHLYIKRF